jgi:hypothetical protein
MKMDLQRPALEDRDRVNMSEEWEVQYWTQTLGVSRERLEGAVKVMGSAMSGIKAYLNKR